MFCLLFFLTSTPYQKWRAGWVIHPLDPSLGTDIFISDSQVYHHKSCTSGNDSLAACLLSIPTAVICRYFNSTSSVKGRRVFPQQAIYFDILVVIRWKNMSVCFVWITYDSLLFFIYAQGGCSFKLCVHITMVLYRSCVLNVCWFSNQRILAHNEE